MVVKASLYRLYVTEVPTTLSPDGRSRPPHLRSWRDGWRHLRFLLLYSPRWLFLYPGLLLILIGLVSTLWFISGIRVHTLLYSATAIIIGFQTVIFALFTKSFATNEGLIPEDERVKKILNFFNLEVSLIVGVFLLVVGILASLSAFIIWERALFGALEPVKIMKIIIPAVTCLAIGFQVVFSGFFLSILTLKRR
jgi:hypothetical protein